MADLNERDAKLVQYLNEAHGKERELETALQAHIAMTTRVPYKKRLQQHLRETKAHAKAVERRIKKLGGDGTSKVGTAVGKAMAVAKGPLHAVRGAGEQEKMLKNAKTEYWNEHEEIATYTAIEILAQKVGDKETARLARDIRREEERMAKFLEGQIKSLTGAVVQEEVPRSQRSSSNSAGRKRPRATKKATGRARARKPGPRGTAKKASGGRRPAAARGGGGSRRKRPAGS
jgi:ferritin-like metal-binding protein YciE